MNKNRKHNIPKLPYGEGSIVELKDGSLSYRKSIKGKRTSVYGDTVREVITKMREKEKELEKQSRHKDNKTLSEALHLWIKKTKAGVLKPSSYDRIECTLRNQIDKSNLGTIRYQSITDEDIHDFINELVGKKYSWSTIKKSYDLLNEFYNYQTLRNYIDDNPMIFVTMPSKENVLKPEKEIEFFDKKDIALFMHEASKMMKHRNLPKWRLGQGLIFMLFTGIRVGEAIALRWKDISFKERTVLINKSIERVINRNYDENRPELMEKRGVNRYIDFESSTKNQSRRLLALNSYALNAIMQVYKYTSYKDKDDYVYAVKDGDCNNISNMTKALNSIQEQAGMTVQNSGMHTLRHTCASLLFRKGLPVEIIANLLGHSPDVCRKTYIHFVQEQQADAVQQLDAYDFEIEIDLQESSNDF